MAVLKEPMIQVKSVLKLNMITNLCLLVSSIDRQEARSRLYQLVKEEDTGTWVLWDPFWPLKWHNILELYVP
jgi:hypothetical protein